MARPPIYGVEGGNRVHPLHRNQNSDAITATLVTRDEVTEQLISRDPVKFAEPVWFGREDVEQAIIDLLPAKFVQLTADEMLIIGEFENGTVPELTWFKARDDE